ATSGPNYFEKEGGLWASQGQKTFQLTNFLATITEDIMKDDGVEHRHEFLIDAALAEHKTQICVPAAQFDDMKCVSGQLGAGAIIYSGPGTKDHARAAIQVLSAEAGITPGQIFSHTGWRKHEGRWIYLHGAGAIGEAGAVAGIAVELPAPLHGFRFEEP